MEGLILFLIGFFAVNSVIFWVLLGAVIFVFGLVISPVLRLLVAFAISIGLLYLVKGL